MTGLLLGELHLLVYSDCTISPAGGVGLRHFPFRPRSPQTERDLGLGNALTCAEARAKGCPHGSVLMAVMGRGSSSLL